MTSETVVTTAALDVTLQQINSVRRKTEYDHNYRPVIVRTPLNSISDTDPDHEPRNYVEYVYDERGMLFQEILNPAAGQNSEGELITEYSYTPSGLIASIKSGDRGIVYKYRGNDLLWYAVDAMGNVTAYQYYGNTDLVKDLFRNGQLYDDPGPKCCRMATALQGLLQRQGYSLRTTQL